MEGRPASRQTLPRSCGKEYALGLSNTGYLVLENGILIGRRASDGEEVGRIFVGPDGLTIEQRRGFGELVIFSEHDPPKLRLASRYTGDTEHQHGKVGGISFNVMRADDRCDEIAYVTGAMVEDAVDSDDRRGQIEFYARKHTIDPETGKGGEPEIAGVITSAYSEERFAKRALWVGLRNLIGNLWKFHPPNQDL
jgi:hypothetical protein